MSAIVFACFFLLSLLGLPIAHALVIGSTVAMGTSERGSLSLIVEQMVSQVGSFPLLAIPFFMLTGSIMMGGTLGRNLLDLLSTLMARFHGGPGQVGVVSSTIFGGISGSAVADASAIGSLLIPWQKKLGYPPGFAAATIAASATIDILIPPSIPFIIYALVSQTSIADLFIAGVLPGMMLCFGFMAVCYVVGRSRGFQREKRPINGRVLLKEFGYSLPGVLLPVLIVIVLRFGIATPTEVASWPRPTRSSSRSCSTAISPGSACWTASRRRGWLPASFSSSSWRRAWSAGSSPSSRSRRRSRPG